MKAAKLYYCDDYSFDCESFLNFLPEERLQKYERLRFEKDKKNCVGTYMLLRRALMDAGYELYGILTTDTGKPYIEGNPVCFSLSHGENGFVCAVHSKGIGVDIQEIVAPRKATVDRICAPEELDAIGDSNLNFTKLWTYKESIIKQKGETLSEHKKYVFSKIDSDFYCHGSHFVSYEVGNNVITVCGDFADCEFVKIKPAEL